MEILVIGLSVLSLSAAVVVGSACALSSRISRATPQESPPDPLPEARPAFVRRTA